MNLEFVIHDLNKFGGQERSTFEIIDGLRTTNHVRVLASSSDGLGVDVKFHRVPVLLRRPLLIKDFVFRIVASALQRPRADVRHATGCCVFSADVYTIQFLHRRWLAELGGVAFAAPLARAKNWIQAVHDTAWEWLVISLNRDRHYVAISSQVAADLRRYYGLKNVHLIPHGVNTREFQPAAGTAPRAPYPGLEGKKTILFAGTFERKGLATVIRALARIDRLDCAVLVVGEGPRQRMQALAQRFGVAERVHFAGATKDIAGFFRSADLFVLPSHYDPFGLVGIEALASGCPAIISRNSGCAELIREGENGYVLEDAGDDKALAGLIEKFFAAGEASPTLNALRRANAAASVAGSDWSDRMRPYSELFTRLAGHA